MITPRELSLKVTAKGREPESGAAVKAAIGYGGTTAVALAAELFVCCGSAAREETTAVLVMVPGAVVLTTSVTVALAPLVKVPRLQMIVPLLLVQLPTLLVAETKLRPEGSTSASMTSEAGLGPRLVKLMV